MSHQLPRVCLAHLPTPLEELPRLSARLGGPRILVKRDDATGLATGGNKARKLEYLIADALQQGADTIITCGAAQSNHARQTAAAAARCGLRCTLVLAPRAPVGLAAGNLLLDRLLGAQVRWAGDRDPYDLMQEVAEEERSVGRHPYLIPTGGSNPIGAVGYVGAMEELAAQLRSRDIGVDHLVFATGSGGTQAGLLVGAEAVGFRGRIVGISVGPAAEELGPSVLSVAHLTAALLGRDSRLGPQDVVIHEGYRGGGYGVVAAAEREAIRLLAEQEGLLLDPVYTARAMAGLIDLVAQGEFRAGETVLFWHTGGQAGLFAEARALLSKDGT
ncbi:MAG: D-cysteine desulfhydrase family protein [Chloroflexi bacterium]|nr:D-cysteine desulfhydrase family protein [Chloroflexota bacterium]